LSPSLRKALFSLLGAALALGGLEGGLRLLPWPDPGIYVGDPAFLWTLRPGVERDLPFPEEGGTFHVRVNSVGFRGPEPAPGSLLCLGDSTTFGWGLDEARTWPARLQAHAGLPVVNGGVPGHSTVQGLAVLDRALALSPRVVVIGYLVRDAELGPMPDKARRPSPPLQLLRAMRALRPAPRSASVTPREGLVPRVPPEDYRANLLSMIERVEAAGARPVLLVFPMREPPQAWVQVLLDLGSRAPLLRPELPESAFFAADPIHLDAEGSELLGRSLAVGLAEGGLLP
jgi:lysophospholipase L1-like esterase